MGDSKLVHSSNEWYTIFDEAYAITFKIDVSTESKYPAMDAAIQMVCPSSSDRCTFYAWISSYKEAADAAKELKAFAGRLDAFADSMLASAKQIKWTGKKEKE